MLPRSFLPSVVWMTGGKNSRLDDAKDKLRVTLCTLWCKEKNQLAKRLSNN